MLRPFPALRRAAAFAAALPFAAAAFAQGVVFAPDALAPMPVPPGGRALPPEDTDRAINPIFASALRIERIQANLLTLTYDTDAPEAPPRAVKTTRGALRLSAPSRMWIEDWGEENGQPRQRRPRDAQCSYMIVDGEWFYDIEGAGAGAPRAQPRGSRQRLADYMAGGDATNVAAVLGMFLGLEKPVTNAAELRADFHLDGVHGVHEGVAQNHFRLVPKRQDTFYVIDLWHRPGEALPWRVKIAERKVVFNPAAPTQDTFKYAHTERRLTEVRTNLDGLKPFGRGDFALPRIRIEWEGGQ